MAVLLIFCGCAGKTVTCNSPYIQVGIDCCLDQNNNSICDRDDTTTTSSTTPTTSSTTSSTTSTIETTSSTTSSTTTTSTTTTTSPIERCDQSYCLSPGIGKNEGVCLMQGYITQVCMNKTAIYICSEAQVHPCSTDAVCETDKSTGNARCRSLKSNSVPSNIVTSGR